MGVGFFGKMFSKVSPTITSVKPSTTVTKKGVKASLDKTRSDEYRKRYTALDKAEGQIKSGKQMIKEGQKARKKMVDTGKAFQFKHSKSTHAIKPGEDPNVKYKGLLRERKAKGGRAGFKKGTGLPKKKSNVDKIKKTFGTLSVRAGIDKNPNPTYADKIAGATMKNKNKKKVI